MFGICSGYNNVDKISFRTPESRPTCVREVWRVLIVELIELEPVSVVPFARADDAIDDRYSDWDLILPDKVLSFISGCSYRAEQNKNDD